MRSFLAFAILIILFAGCNPPADNSSTIRFNAFANGFQLIKKDQVTRLTVFNPWEKAKNITVDYFLIDKRRDIPDYLFDKRVIKTPVERVICLSTTHLSFLDVLDETDAVVGISGSQYVSCQKIRQRMEMGEVPDVGYGQNLNYELIVTQKPDLVMLYGVGSEVTGIIQKLEELGIPVIMMAEFLEENPLGKAEWINFVAALFQKEKEAASFFKGVVAEYQRLKELTEDVIEKPKVMVGSPYKDSWWVPGGNSYLANLISDAGGNYLGKDNTSHESYIISFENALVWGSIADIWINMGNLASRKEIIAADERFRNFNVFRERKIFNNIKRLGSHGGNDFWESGTVNPHLVLRDLIRIFHPGLADGETYYYLEIE